MSKTETTERWPALPLEAWRDTKETLHMWTQVVGKVRLALSPFENHWWHVPLYVTVRGLTTSSIPYRGRTFEVQFDFIDHNLFIQASDGSSKAMPLISRSVADFCQEFIASLRALEIEITINTLPSEVTNPIHFDQDFVHAAYDPEYVNRFWLILVQTDTVLKRYRSQFLGKSSPVHFFWGSFDLALTFFSGQRAPERPGVDSMQREAASHEEICCGFWPGDERFPEPAYYSYAYPAPSGVEASSLRPAEAFYDPQLGEFLLRYNDVRNAGSPDQALLDFFQIAYEASATLAQWDRAALERSEI